MNSRWLCQPQEVGKCTTPSRSSCAMYQLAKANAAPSTSADSPMAPRANCRRQTEALSRAQISLKARSGEPGFPKETKGTNPCADDFGAADQNNKERRSITGLSWPETRRLQNPGKFDDDQPLEYLRNRVLVQPPSAADTAAVVADYPGSASQIDARSEW
jgi:hypothetical protein